MRTYGTAQGTQFSALWGLNGKETLRPKRYTNMCMES